MESNILAESSWDFTLFFHLWLIGSRRSMHTAYSTTCVAEYMSTWDASLQISFIDAMDARNAHNVTADAQKCKKRFSLYLRRLLQCAIDMWHWHLKEPDALTVPAKRHRRDQSSHMKVAACLERVRLGHRRK